MKLLRLLIASTLLLMACTSTAFAQYTFQLVKPPGAFDANLFGMNDAGKAVGNVFDEFGFVESYVYDIKKGTFESTSGFDSIDINTPGMIVGSAGVNYDQCAFIDKKGNVSFFYPPAWTESSFCAARGANPNGLVSGFVIDEFNWWTGFIYDSKKDTFEEFLPSWQTIPQGINAQGQNVGSVFLPPDEAYLGSVPGRYGFLREPDGLFRYFEIAQAAPGSSRIRGLSDNGKISGFFFNPATLEFTGYATTLPEGDGFATISLVDDEVLHLRPCNADQPDPPDGYVFLTDVFIADIRNDGVVSGQCTDYHINWDTFDFYPVGTWGLIGTPEK